MNFSSKRKLVAISLTLVLISSCTSGMKQADQTPTLDLLRVVAVESFLADIAQQVAGDAFEVDTLVPYGVDPHVYQPTPKDLAKIAESDVLVMNGGGLESWISESLENIEGQRSLIDASDGLPSRTMSEDEIAEHAGDEHTIDPHFWLDPNLVKQYVTNIRDGFSAADPDRADEYKANADAYIQNLTELDAWVRGEVEKIPPAERILVTNHESFGYFADRYGFKIIGAIIPSVSSGASPSAKHLADLIDKIRASGAKVIFLETGANPQLAAQIAAETGVKVVNGLASHSLELSSGQAATYLELMRHNVRLIVDALQ